MLKDMLKEGPRVVNIGLDVLEASVKAQDTPVVSVAWKPHSVSLSLLKTINEFTQKYSSSPDTAVSEKIKRANEEAIERISLSQPVLFGMGIAKEVIPGFGDKMLLHAGPPITWDRMSGPMRGAVIGAILYEGWAKSFAQAQSLASSGEICFDPCHHHQAVGPMAGLISPSMPVFIIKNLKYGNLSYATMNEGFGQVLRMGAFSEKVISHLHWMRDTLYPVLKKAVETLCQNQKPLNLKAIISQALHMGDEMHNRNKAATSLFIRQIAPVLSEIETDQSKIAQVLRFIDSNDHFFLNLAMASAKGSLETCANIPHCSLVYVMARNGTDFGIHISALGNQWFTCPAALPHVLLFPGFTQEDVNPDIGDSAIMETYGIGGFALANAPAIVQFVGGTPQDAANYTLEMYQICMAENRDYTIPVFQFRGTPTGIDVLKVIEKNITPILDTGAACKEAGRGQVGAGIVRMPFEAFLKAAQAFSADNVATT